MKRRWLRITLWSIAAILLIGGIGWWWFMKRSIPQHARCIPRSAAAVALLNTKALFLDVYFGGSLYGDSLKKEKENPLVKQFTNAVKENGGDGISYRSDILAFAETDSAGQLQWIGAVAKLSDSATFASLVRKQLPQILHGKFVKGKTPFFYIDSSKTCIGWSEDALLALQPAPNHNFDSAACAKHLTELLAQNENVSVLADQNFKDFCLAKFDAGLWLNGKTLDKSAAHMPGLFAANDDYVHLLIDFNKGEAVARCTRFGIKAGEAQASTDPMIFDDPEKLPAFFRFAFNPAAEKGSLLSPGSIPWQWLNNKTGDAKKWIDCLDGNVSMAINDTVTYQRSYITYDYDEDFNPVQITKTENASAPGFTLCFSVKNQKAFSALLEQYVHSDTNVVQLETGKYEVHGELPIRLSLEGKYFFVHTQQDAYAAPRAGAGEGIVIRPALLDKALPAAWRAGLIGALLPEWKANIERITFSAFLRDGDQATSETRVRFRNGSVNALVQFGEMSRKAEKLFQ